MRRSSAWIVAMVMLAAAAAGSAEAKTHYVATAAGGGADSNDGSAAKPWASIDHALANAAGRDEIIVRDGVYDGATYQATGYSDWVTLRAEHPYRATLTAASSGKTVLFIATKGSQKLIIEGFILTNRHASYSCPSGRESNFVLQIEGSRDVTVRNNIIAGNNAPGTCNELLKVNRSGNEYTRNINIEGNLFYDHANASGADMIDSVRPGELDIHDNIFFARNAPNAQSFITIKRQADAAAAGVTPRSPRFRIYRNVFLSYDGKGDQAFVQLGEDGDAEVMVSDALVENNLLLGNSGKQMAAPFQLKGTRDVVVRANTVSGDLPSGAYGFRIGTEGQNPRSRDIRIGGNIFSDPTGTMGNRFINTYGDVDVASIALDFNLYYNGGSALPTTETPAPAADANGVVADPLLANAPTAIVEPLWDGGKGAFASGSTTIRAEFERLVQTYGAIAATSPARDAADPANMPADDILGRARSDGKPDIGAFELVSATAGDGPAAGDAPVASGDGTVTPASDRGAAADSATPAGDSARKDGGGNGSNGDDGCGCSAAAPSRGLSPLLAVLWLLLLCWRARGRCQRGVYRADVHAVVAEPSQECGYTAPMSDQLTFRDFAGAVMAKDTAKAADVLQVLLGLDAARADAAAKHFDGKTACEGQAFMMKAMGLRTAVTSGSDDDVAGLLGECFGLSGDDAASATTALRKRYPADS